MKTAAPFAILVKVILESPQEGYQAQEDIGDPCDHLAREKFPHWLLPDRWVCVQSVLPADHLAEEGLDQASRFRFRKWLRLLKTLVILLRLKLFFQPLDNSWQFFSHHRRVPLGACPPVPAPHWRPSRQWHPWVT